MNLLLLNSLGSPEPGGHRSGAGGRAETGKPGAPPPRPCYCLGMVKSHAVSWAHFHIARMSRVKPMSLGFSKPLIRRCFIMATNSLLLSSPFPAGQKKPQINTRNAKTPPTTSTLHALTLEGSSHEHPFLQRLKSRLASHSRKYPAAHGLPNHGHLNPNPMDLNPRPA